MNSLHFYFVKNLLQKVMSGNAEGKKDLRLGIFVWPFGKASKSL